MLGHTIAYLVVIAISLAAAYTMGKPAGERQDEGQEIAEIRKHESDMDRQQGDRD